MHIVIILLKRPHVQLVSRKAGVLLPSHEEHGRKRILFPNRLACWRLHVNRKQRIERNRTEGERWSVRCRTAEEDEGVGTNRTVFMQSLTAVNALHFTRFARGRNTFSSVAGTVGLCVTAGSTGHSLRSPRSWHSSSFLLPPVLGYSFSISTMTENTTQTTMASIKRTLQNKDTTDHNWHDSWYWRPPSWRRQKCTAANSEMNRTLTVRQSCGQNLMSSETLIKQEEGQLAQ